MNLAALSPPTERPTVTVVLPCLNEVGSVAAVVAEARRSLEAAALAANALRREKGLRY